MEKNPNLTAFTSKIQVFSRPEWTKRGGPHENEFWQFSNAKMIFVNSKGSKSRLKNGVICLDLVFPSWVMALQLSEIVSFL